MTGPGRAPVTVPATILAALALVSSVIGLLDEGGPGRQVVRTYRGAEVILYGEGLYAADAWLQGSGNRGQDLAIVLVEVPLLLVAVWWYRKRGTVAPAALTGVLAFFTYFYASMVFATAQNRLFPMYVAAAALAGFGLVFVAGRMDVPSIAAALPDRPGGLALVIYLLAVAAAAASIDEVPGRASGATSIQPGSPSVCPPCLEPACRSRTWPLQLPSHLIVGLAMHPSGCMPALAEPRRASQALAAHRRRRSPVRLVGRSTLL
jgi:hypothetical protein